MPHCHRVMNSWSTVDMAYSLFALFFFLSLYLCVTFAVPRVRQSVTLLFTFINK
jgi:hypothetical protein